MALVDSREAGLYWQSRMGNNADGIGGNCHRYDVVTTDGSGGLSHRRLIVDMGIKLGGNGHYACQFPSPEGLLAHRQEGLPDDEVPAEALLLTHAHEDHLGAIRHALDMGFEVPPIHCTAFTAELVRKSLVASGIDQSQWPAIHVVGAGERVPVAGAQVEFVPVDHLPGATALLIRTPEASVFHTGDYKFDSTLLLGDRADPARLRAIGREGVDVVVSDSTAATERGEKVPEQQIRQNLTQIVADNEGRAVVAGILGTQLDRLVSLGRAAAANDRALIIMGKSLVDNVRALERTGTDLQALIGTQLLTAPEAKDLNADKALVVTTGAFAQPLAGLTRAAERQPGALWLGADTTVVIPQRAIPPVAGAHAAMVAKLEKLGAVVITAERAEALHYGPVHQSGHAMEMDTRLLYSLLKPKHLVVPTHGNGHQLEANARLARSLGVKALPLDVNGTVLKVDHGGVAVLGREEICRIGAADSGQVKHRPRARRGEGRRSGPAPALYRYDELDPAGKTVLAADRYRPRPVSPPTLDAAQRADSLAQRSR